MQEDIVRCQHACKANRNDGRVIERPASTQKGNDEGIEIGVTALRRWSVEDSPIKRGFPVDERLL